MKTLKDFKVKNKRVLVRCDFNVPLDEKGNIEDDFRIKQSIPTIEYLVKNRAKVILISHLGRLEKVKREGLEVKSYSLRPVALRLEKLLGRRIEFLEDCIEERIEKRTKEMKQGEILLLENLRFYKGEKENDSKFAKELAKLGDIYINNAFGVCHRAHASIAGLPKYLPSGGGFLLEKEVKVLSSVLENPWRPLVAIIGGVKLESKAKLLKELLEKADHLLIGGKIANTVLIVKGIIVARPWPSEKVVEEIKKLNLTSTKLHLPLDAMASPDRTGKIYIRQSAPAKVRKDEELLDIGPETIKIFSEIIKEAKMIVWAGPLGYFEQPPFDKGSREIAEAIARNHKAYKIVGGGDTLFALSKFGLRDKFDHISTGGGAMLSFLSGEELPGLKALEPR